MTSSFLLALIDPTGERPFHARDAVAALLAPRLSWAAEDNCRAWCVGGVVGGETLVQTRPIVRDGSADLVDDLLRPASICTVAAHISTTEAPRAPAATRFQRYVGMAVGSWLADANADPSRIRDAEAALPGFLGRARVTGKMDELLILRIVARLSTMGALGSTSVSSQAFREALDLVAADLPEDLDGDLALIITDGRKVGGIVRGTACTLSALPHRSPTRNLPPWGSGRPVPAPQMLLLTPAAVERPAFRDRAFVLDSADPTKIT